MNNDRKDEKFNKLKRWIIGVSGVGMAVASIILSKQGVGITGELAWIGTVIALSLFCAELMFNSNFDELNWTILALGLGAYVYSIWTNIQGFYFYRGISGTLFTNFDVTSFFGGVFLDVYPEIAIAWAMGASKIGDIIGNVVKTSRNPDKLTNAVKEHTEHKTYQVPQSIKAAHRSTQMGFQGSPRPVPKSSNVPAGRPYATYHQVTTRQDMDEDE
jgi:hypothetical protein